MRVTASVPARINIIGEHTDHFGGLSLTFSSQHRLELSATPREDGIRGNQTVTSLWEAAGGWSADLVVDSNIPIGAGLSSSAALCVAIVMCSQNKIDPMEISLEAQRIENQVLRSNCGLMDQISITHSTEGLATLLDYSRMSIENFRMPDDWRFKLVDTGIRRSLSKTNYSSSEIDIETRRIHAEEESERVRHALSSDARALGGIINESHASISDNIRSSTPEIDTMVKEIQGIAGVLGARLMGGGFGGMILALVEEKDALSGELLVSSGSAFLQKTL
tara:strand:- start:2144 stop:2977 length:834 start_codon:yes stop_codon:yes gene_type:complete